MHIRREDCFCFYLNSKVDEGRDCSMSPSDQDVFELQLDDMKLLKSDERGELPDAFVEANIVG